MAYDVLEPVAASGGYDVLAPEGKGFDVIERQSITSVPLDAYQQAQMQAGGRVDSGDNSNDFLTSIANDPKGFLKSLPADVMHGVGTAAAALMNYPVQLWRADTGTPKTTETTTDEQGQQQMREVDAPLPFAAGQPIVSLHRPTVLQPEGNDFSKLAEGVLTPENIALFPFGGSKLVQAAFLAQTAPAAIEAGAKLFDPSLSREEKQSAATDALINTIMSYGIGAHMAEGSGNARAQAAELNRAQPQPATLNLQPETRPIEVTPDLGAALQSALRGNQGDNLLRPQAEALPAQLKADENTTENVAPAAVYSAEPVPQSDFGKAESGNLKSGNQQPALKPHQEFKNLVLEYADRKKWGSPQTIEDAQTVSSGANNLGSLGVQGNIKRGAAIKTVLMQAAKEIGLDPNEIGKPSYQAQNLPKLKKLLSQTDQFETETQNYDFGKQEIPATALKVGDEITVAGEQLKVKAVRPDHVEVEDGRKFGTQIIDGNQSVYVEGHEAKSGKRKAEMEAAAATPLVGSMGDIGQKSLGPGDDDLLAAGGKTNEPLGPGMGAAIPQEFEKSPLTPTSIKNATVDVERQRRGLPPAMQAARRGFGEVWDAAMARVDQQPDAADQLVQELSAAPRALTDSEDALLLHRQIELQNEYGQVTRDMAMAWDDAKEFPNRLADVEEGKLRAAALMDQLHELYDINKAAGTETGRGLAARKMLAYEDYSLANMEVQQRSAKGGVPLTDEERAQIGLLQEKIQSTEKAFNDYQAKVEHERANRMTDEAIADMQARLAKQPTYDSRVIKMAEGIVSKLENQAKKSSAEVKAMLSRMNAGIDPTLIYHLGVVGAAKIARGGLDFAKFSTAMAAEFGDKVKPIMRQVWERANLHLDNEGAKYGDKATQVKNLLRKRDEASRRENIIGGLKKGQAEGIPPSLLGDYVRKLAESFVRAGVKEREPLIDAVHQVLTDEVGMTLTRRETMDAISGYGSFKALNPEEIKAQLRDLRGQMQQVAKLEDIQGREPLKKTGVQRRVPSDEERRLIQQVNEAKRRLGVVVSDPASNLKSALDSIKTRLTHQISDLDYQITTKERIVKTKSPTPFDAETKLLELRRDELKRQLDELLPKPGLTDAQRVDIAKRNLERTIADYEQRVQAGEVSARSRKPLLSTPELEALRARRDAVRQEWEHLRKGPQKSKDEIALASLKTRLLNQTATYAERLARKDFTPRPRRTVTLDAEASRLKAESIKAKQAFQRGLIAERLKQRPWYVRAQDTFVKWRRGFLLSSPVTLAKLTSAAIQRMAFTPVEEMIGAGWSLAIPKLAAMAPREGGLNIGAESKALASAITQGMADAAHTLKDGRGQMDTLYGKGKDGSVGESDVLPRSVIDFFGSLHGALKAPVKRAEFERSFAKRTAWNMRRGVDVSDPLVQTRLAVEAYKDANRSIFLQDNLVVSKVNAFLAAKRDPKTQQPTLEGKLWETAGRVMLPIVRVPTNLVAEAFQYALGLPSGLARLGVAMRPGIETLPQEQADMILRHLKKGSIGAAVMLTGYLLPQYIGGYYQPGKKQEVKFGSLKIGGVNIPSYLLHNPLLEMLQLGATIRRVQDEQLNTYSDHANGIGPGLLAGGLGLAEETPFIREQLEMSKAFNPLERGAFFGELAKSIAVPQLLQWYAGVQDQDQNGERIKRKPATVLQHIETGIPWLRKSVPDAEETAYENKYLRSFRR